jgi:anti-sigma factor RsiW
MHDHETVAAYVAGELVENAHTEFEAHLLACEECWSEVEAGRRGRELAQLVYETAPESLRNRIVRVVTALPAETDDEEVTARGVATVPMSPPAVNMLAVARRAAASKRRGRFALVAAAIAACVAVISFGVVAIRGDSGPEPVAAAAAGFLGARLPGAQIPDAPAPDLSKIGFTSTAAGAGTLAGLPVTAYAYRDQVGRRLLVYVGEKTFPPPDDEKEEYEHYDGSWVTHEDGVAVLCGREPHSTLVVGQDEQLVRQAAELLDVA